MYLGAKQLAPTQSNIELKWTDVSCRTHSIISLVLLSIDPSYLLNSRRFGGSSGGSSFDYDDGGDYQGEYEYLEEGVEQDKDVISTEGEQTSYADIPYK